MKEKFRNLDTNIKVGIVTALVTIFIFLTFIPCFFYGWKEIPLGLILGGGLGSIAYVVQGLVAKKDEEKQATTLSILVMGVRFILFAGLLILIAFLYYKNNTKIFNVFSYVGGYTIATITLVIFMLKEKK